MTSYETVFKRFENKVEDIKVLKLASDDWTELCLEWLNSAIAMIELDQLKIEHDLTKKNDVLFEFEDTLTNGEIEVVALYMVVAWYDIRLNSLERNNNISILCCGLLFYQNLISVKNSGVYHTFPFYFQQKAL